MVGAEGGTPWSRGISTNLCYTLFNIIKHSKMNKIGKTIISSVNRD